MLSETSSSYLRTIQDKNVTTETRTDIQRHPTHPKRLFEDVWPFRLTSNGGCCCILVPDGVCQCLMLSGDLGRVFEEFLKGYLSAVYGHVWGLVHLRVYLSVQALYCTANALALKVKIPLTYLFWNIKIPKSPHKKLSKNHWVWAFFWKNFVRQKQTTCDSLVRSPCTRLSTF